MAVPAAHGCRCFETLLESELGGHAVTAIDPTRVLAELAAAQARATAREADADDDPAGIDFLERVVDGMWGFDPSSPSEARSPAVARFRYAAGMRPLAPLP